MTRRLARTVLALALAAAGCASSSSPSARASREIRFGARVARKDYWREARFRFETAVRLEPKSARAHNDLAVALEALGDFSAAFDEYKTAITLAPDSRPIRDNYAAFAKFYTAYTKTTGKVPSAP
jgi:Tfp pilus assembly protein PilF